MVEDRGHGTKRKLSDSDGDLQNRCYQRQTVFNISLCKLRKNYGTAEPLLSKTVLIANTIRLIEDDIEEENRQIKQLFCGVAPYDMSSRINGPTELLGTRDLEGEFEEDGERLLQSFTRELASKKPLDSVCFEKELSLLGDKLIRELGLDYTKNCDRRDFAEEKTERLTDLNNNTSNERIELDIEREIVSCSSLLGLELSDELEFGDVDLSLYDFDGCGAGGLPVEVEELCAAWSLSNSFPSRCGASVKLERNTDTFDELDQVMQVLVGS